jgi:ABC-type iron transport system FetAB ATPase subunit
MLTGCNSNHEGSSLLNLSFHHIHASITKFPSTSLPDFTLITGPNGVGKTHLLRAIESGALSTDVGQVGESIRFFDWNSMSPSIQEPLSGEQIRAEKDKVISFLTSMKIGMLEPARVIVRKHNLPEKFEINPELLIAMNNSELTEFVGSSELAEQTKTELLTAFSNAEANFGAHLGPAPLAMMQRISSLANKPLAALSIEDIDSSRMPLWGESDVFQQSFARLFVEYRDLALANEIAELKNSKGIATKFLSQAEFVNTYGAPPWEFVNKTLKDSGLDFTINHPPSLDFSSFQPKLTKTASGAKIPFSELSSGEKILMSFAFCIYYARDRRQLLKQPKLLLLDEIDAPLHPAMTRVVLNTICNHFVGTSKIKVIATTHSPSTIALAPNESIYTMQLGSPGLYKTSKDEALNILTVGVPTLAISYEGRRQVFVESPTDAKIYTLFYELLKSNFCDERSLEFVATGTRDPAIGDRNTGCEIVKSLVKQLSAAGNTSIFGLVDWDGNNDPTDRISVLAHKAKNGLENVALDPLLIGLTIIRDFPDYRERVGVQKDLSYIEAMDFDKERLQKIATKVAATVLNSPAKVNAIHKYVGGMEIQIDERYSITDDHTLEKMILASYPFLNSVAKKRSGNLIEHIISKVLSDRPDLIPFEMKVAMKELLECPAHVPS